MRRVVVAEPEPLHGPGAEILDQDVGGADERARGGKSRRAFEIENHALLVTIDRAERRTVLDPAPAAKRITTVGRFNLDNLRAEISKQHSGVWAGNIIGKFDDPDAVQCSWH